MAILSFYAGANGGGSADKFKVVNVPDFWELGTNEERISIDAYIQQAGITMDEFLALFDLYTIAVTDDGDDIMYKSSGFRTDDAGFAVFGCDTGMLHVGYKLEITFDLGQNFVLADFTEV